MTSARAFLAILVCLTAAAGLTASGPIGLYAVLEKVAFEPNEQSPERIKLWGVFSFADGGIQSGVVAAPVRGYLYFRMPTPTEAPDQGIRNEWSDLKAVAGTGQAIAFGNWGYIGGFNVKGANQIFVTVRVGERMFRGMPLRVYDASETAAEPTPYVTNTGIVKLSDSGSHAAIVKQLKDSLKR